MNKRKIKRDYSINSYSNPLFNKRQSTLKKNKNIKKAKILLLLSSIVLFCFFIGYILYGNYLKINNIIIEGNKDVTISDINWFIDQELNKSIFIPYDNYLFVDQSLADLIKNKFYFKEVELKKTFPNTLNITIMEKVPIVILMVGDKKYLLDGDGTMIGLVDQSKADEFSSLIKIADESNQVTIDDLIATNTTLVSNNEMLFVYKILNFTEKNNLKINLYKKKEFNEFVAELDSGVKIVLDTTENLEKQMDKLATVILNIGEIKEYIDVRFGDKVFYK